MPQVQIACHHCGMRVDADLNEAEVRTLRTQGAITRYCRKCAGNTRWVAQKAAGPTRLGGSESTPFRDSNEAAELRGGRILLIDDDEGILAILSKVLSKENLEIDVASTGREAVVKLGREDYDLILSDIRMPELDGKQLFAFLDQNLPEYKKKVIFLTGDTGNPETVKFLEETRCPYLTKPLEIPTLMLLLYQYFGA